MLWALLSPQLGAALLPADTLRNSVKELFDEDPSPTDGIVDEYVSIVRRATTWERPPTIHAPSVSYFKAHFAAFDPDRQHAFPDVRKLRPAPVADLAVASPLFVGTPVIVSGPLLDTPTVVTTGAPGTISWAFSIRDPDVKDAVILARVPVRGPLRVHRGDRVSITGLVMADGAARYAVLGLTRVVYLAGSSIVPSTQIVIRTPHRRP